MKPPEIRGSHMKKKSAILVLLLIVIVKAQEVPRFEAGVLLGEPASLSIKWWYGKRSAFDAAAGWYFGEGGKFEFHIDYLLHLIYPNIARGELPLYTGIGLSIRLGDEAFFGARVPIGIEFLIQGLPLSIFGEIAPVFEAIPENKVNLSGGVGIRLNFGTAHRDTEENEP